MFDMLHYSEFDWVTEFVFGALQQKYVSQRTDVFCYIQIGICFRKLQAFLFIHTR